MESIWLLIPLVILMGFQIWQLLQNKSLPPIGTQKLDELQSAISKLEQNLKLEFKSNREENASAAKLNREELAKALSDFRSETANALLLLNQQNANALEKLNQTLEQKVIALINKTDEAFKAFALANTNQTEKAFAGFQQAFDQHSKAFNDLQREKFTQLEAKQNELVLGTEKKLESIRTTVEEKLEKTLSERLGQSFETVGKQLIEVQKGLGEMQTIAADVGGLKRVLSHVKLRGGFGEVQLAMLLEQMLAPAQYEANVATKPGSRDAVEFAIKLPGRSEDEKEVVYLPIDAKFPKDTYEQLINAYDSAIPSDIDQAGKQLETTIKKMAKDIRDKYIAPPNTTDFAILFLPFESIYAEVIRRSALVDQLRDEFKITLAGPTTLMAILNSLQMGFRTLALQKRSSEVWKILASVKTEFEKFGGLLDKAHKNIQTGLGQLDDVVGVRTRAINRQLRQVDSLPAAELPTPLSSDDFDSPETENLL